MDNDFENEEDFLSFEEDFTDIGENDFEAENEHDILHGLHEVAWLRSNVATNLDETPYF